MEEQYQRFCEALRTVDGYSTNCERCPIAEECSAWGMSLTPEEQDTAPCCEEILFRYLMTGEKPRLKTKGDCSSCYHHFSGTADSNSFCCCCENGEYYEEIG